MRKIATVILGTTTALVLAASPALAYTGDPIDTGEGFVGKGEVQQPWGWNNATLQRNASDVRFTVEGEDRFQFQCEWVTGPERNRKTHDVTLKRSTSVNKAVVREVRNNPKSAVTGFNLLGFGAITTTGSVPALGDSCIGEGTNGTVVEVTDVEDTAPMSLLAHYPGMPSLTLADTNPVT